MAILILERLDFRSKNIIRDTEAHLIKWSPHLWGFPGGASGKEDEVAQSCLTLCHPM